MGMGLARKYELNGAFGIVHHLREAFQLSEDQVGSLVRCKPPGEADRQRVGAECASQLLQKLRRFLPAFGLFNRRSSNEFQKAQLQAEMRFAEFAVIDVFYTLPELRLAASFRPAWAEMTVVEFGHLRRKPRRNMDSVRDMTNRHGFFVLTWKQPRPHRARNRTM